MGTRHGFWWHHDCHRPDCDCAAVAHCAIVSQIRPIAAMGSDCKRPDWRIGCGACVLGCVSVAYEFYGLTSDYGTGGWDRLCQRCWLGW